VLGALKSQVRRLAKPAFSNSLASASSGVPQPGPLAARIIESAEVEPAPRRMVLGSRALQSTLGDATKRIEGFEAKTELAASTDFPPGQ
jgi:hypothetical protein